MTEKIRGLYDTRFEDLADVALSGDFNDLTNKPTLGSAASQDSTAFATAAQGAKADSAEQTANKNQPLGYAGLDGGGKIPAAFLPNSVLELQGSWDASTNTPALSDGTGTPGNVYEVTVAGTVDFGHGPIAFSIGDWAIYGADGKWFKSVNSNAVNSVNGMTGVVTITKSSIGLGNVDNTSDLNKPISSATQAALSLKADTSSLATVATTGSYSDLTNKPTLGTAASQNSSAFATAAQGAKADSAVQPGSLANVATSGSYTDLTNTPNFGTAAFQPSSAFATAVQGAHADSAVQPGDLSAVATSGQYSDLIGKPSLATVATTGQYSDLLGKPSLGSAASQPSSAFATAAQGAKADSAVQPGSLATVAFSGSYSDLTNKPALAAVATSGSYSDLTGTPVLGTAAYDAASAFATAAQGTKADSAEQPVNKNQANGYAGLDGGGKIPASLLPSSVMELQGQWNAYTNTPTLADGTGNAGDIYEVTVQGTQDLGSGPIDFLVGDWIVYGAMAKWYRSPNTNEVSSVNGRAGAVVLSKSDVGLSNVDNTSDLNKPISTATQTALNLKANTSSLAAVATSGQYSDLLGKPTLGTAASQNSSVFATAAQGAKADSAVQPGSLATVATSGSYSDLTNVPSTLQNIDTLLSLRATRVSVPASSTSSGTVGQYAVDANYIYHCIATDTWVRVPVSTF